jgi:hypothetical protein
MTDFVANFSANSSKEDDPQLLWSQNQPQEQLLERELIEPLSRLDLEAQPGALAEVAICDLTDSTHQSTHESSNQPNPAPICVRLDVEDLPCFAVVNRQYDAWGVRFSNVVALRPSNPAYPPHSGSMVLFGAPNQGWIEATFARPVQHVSSFVTSSRRTVMRAFNRHNQLVAEAESPAANLRGADSNHDPNLRPNLRLSLDGRNIRKVTFHSHSGHLTIDDFCFCG